MSRQPDDPPPSSSSSRSSPLPPRPSPNLFQLDEIVPALGPTPAPDRPRTDPESPSITADSTDLDKFDDPSLEEGRVRSAIDTRSGTPRQSRRERSSSWIAKWARRDEPGVRAGGGSGSIAANDERPPTKLDLTVSSRKGIVLAPVGPYQQMFDDWLVRFQQRHPRLGSTLLWLRGPSPAQIETALTPFPLPVFGPFLTRVERWCTARLEPVRRQRRFTTPVFFLAWLLGLAFLVRASFFVSTTNVGTPEWVVSTSTFWSRNDGCGLNGTECEPFTNSSFVFRCPAQTLSTKLLNARTIGSDQVIYEPLVVGGTDAERTYRADSWICAAAIHRGLFQDKRGGCGELELVGEFTNYVGGRQNGVDSVGFPSVFPSSYRFVDSVEQGSCHDLRNDILGFDVAMSVLFSFLIRPAPQAFFWGLFVFGYWHVVLASDPTTMPPDVATGFKYFLPALFVGESFWRHCWRWVVPAFENSGSIIERTVWYLAGFWVGLLVNVTLGWIPIDRLTPHDIKQQPGGVIAVIFLAIFLFFAILNQIRVIRRTGWFFFHLKWYVVGGIVIAILACLPGLELRLHHYIAGMALMPGTAFVTRPSAIFQGFLLGLFLDGIARWGFDSIVETTESLIGDGTLGTSLPVFLTNSTTFVYNATESFVQWLAIDQAGQAVQDEGWTGFSLLLDDVLVQTGISTNYSLAGLDTAVPHFLRLAYTKSGSAGDFTKAATAFLSNSTWIDPAPGAT
ncbi:hypothetical protein JCM10212_003508 [Sporobolomyces blumeae]